jgi:hypothetical protein
VILMVCFFHIGSEVQDVPPNQKWAFLTIMVILKDLMNIKQGLIHNYNSVQQKLVNYFI